MRRLLAILLLFASPALAADYYIAPFPGHGAGTLEVPFRLADLPSETEPGAPAPAVDVLQPGDTLHFRAGRYVFAPQYPGYNYGGAYLRPRRSGLPYAPITFRCHENEPVTLVNQEAKDGGDIVPLAGDSVRPNVGFDYIRFFGFTVEAGEWDGFVMYGNGGEIAYNHVIGQYRETVDNHHGMTFGGQCWVHHNEIEGVIGDSANSKGIFISKPGIASVIEANHVHHCTTGIYNKGEQDDVVIRGNLVAYNSLNETFIGPGIKLARNGPTLRAKVYGNVPIDCLFDGVLADDTDCHDNLFILPADHMGLPCRPGGKRAQFWNNIVVLSKSLYGFTTIPLAYSKNLPDSPFAYSDHNVFVKIHTLSTNPKWGFSDRTFPWNQWRAEGWDTNSRLFDTPSELWRDPASFTLRPNLRRIGRGRSQPGPDNVAEILDTRGYGPAALGVVIPAPVAPR